MFKTENDTGADAPWVLICGPSAIGKSYFMAACDFYRARPALYKAGYNPELFDIANVGGPKIKSKAGIHHHVALTSQPKTWPDNWYTKEYNIKQRAIILGVPYFVWQERIQKRRLKKPDKKSWSATIDTFEGWYNTSVKKLNKNNIPYIFVDNRNDYPVLDQSSFFAMLRDNE
jgi:hypothetical protein